VKTVFRSETKIKNKQMNKNVRLLYVDLFCGAGGTSTGVESAKTNGKQCAKVIGCVNHDKNAITSHAENHPEALHFTEDIRTLELSPLIEHIKDMREVYPNAYLVLWASLECTNFSKAKGGLPRDADSRTLAEHLFRYIDAIDPDFIQIENVEEFMSWGDLDEKGKPISKDAGRLYRQWVDNVKGCGYKFKHRILNSADLGAYTSRRRFFGVFAKKGLPIVFPEATHSKNGETGLFGALARWKPVRDVLDFEDEGESIFGRKKPLVDATLERIYAGLIKFVAGGKDKWLLKYNSVNGQTRKHIPPSIDVPCPTVSCQGRLGLVQTSFLSKHFSGHPESKNISVEKPAGAITTKDHHSLITTNFLARYNGQPNQEVNALPITSPAPTLTVKDRLAKVEACFLDMQYGNGTPTDINNPAATVTTNPKHQLVVCENWIMNTNFGNVGSSLNSPAPTITANRKWHYLMDAQYSRVGRGVDKPCFTLIARMDKTPPYLIASESGEIAIRIDASDSPAMVKIKEFMALYGIIDIKMRMLRIPELKQIMGFPKDYVLIGTQADQKKFIGNAVEVRTARKLCEALCSRLNELSLFPQYQAA
jgi:Site-specific DNA methylase